MQADSGTYGQLWYKSLKRAEESQKNKFPQPMAVIFFLLLQPALCRSFYSIKFASYRFNFSFQG